MTGWGLVKCFYKPLTEYGKLCLKSRAAVAGSGATRLARGRFVGIQDSETVLNMSQVHSHGQRFANFIGSMQLPHRMPAISVSTKPNQILVVM